MRLFGMSAVDFTVSGFKAYTVICWFWDNFFSLYHAIKEIIFPKLNDGHAFIVLSEYRKICIKYQLLEVLRGNASIRGFGKIEVLFRDRIPTWIFQNLYRH